MLLSLRSALHSSPPYAAEPRLLRTRRRIILRTVAGERGSGAVSKERRRPRPTDDYHATVKSLNARGRHVPKKSLGQNYMLNSSINEELAIAAEIKEGDVVLEIGPGTGSLTNTLLNSGATVVAIEKDARMAALLKDRFGSIERLKLIQEDITKCHIQSHIAPLLENNKSTGSEQKLAKVVANIPFNISTEVVKLLLPMGNTFSYVALLLQDEAALRLVDASVESPEYRSINIFVNFYSDPEYILKVGRSNFFPIPKFDAAIVRFKLKQISEYPVASPKSFFSTVKSGFHGKRKMLRKTLQHLSTSIEIESALENIGLPNTSRGCELTLDDFVRLHNLLVKT